MPLKAPVIGPYPCNMIDGPWNEKGGGKSKRGADRWYPTMNRQDILHAIVTSPAWNPADDAHCWVWATNNHLADAMWLIDALGFRYITNAVWIKLRPGAKVDSEVIALALAGAPLEEIMRKALATGLGQYLRGGHELLLLGVRGKGAQVRTEARNVPSVILGRRGAHSSKPEAGYLMIENRTKGPRMEFFAREPRDGWSSWGPVQGHRWEVLECDRFRSGHQSYAEALVWCRLHHALEGVDLAGIGDFIAGGGEPPDLPAGSRLVEGMLIKRVEQ